MISGLSRIPRTASIILSNGCNRRSAGCFGAVQDFGKQKNAPETMQRVTAATAGSPSVAPPAFGEVVLQLGGGELRV